eukprot:Gb_32419 [translate_table: standard]
MRHFSGPLASVPSSHDRVGNFQFDSLGAKCLLWNKYCCIQYHANLAYVNVGGGREVVIIVAVTILYSERWHDLVDRAIMHIAFCPNEHPTTILKSRSSVRGANTDMDNYKRHRHASPSLSASVQGGLINAYRTAEEIILEMHKDNRQHHLEVFLPWLFQGLSKNKNGRYDELHSKWWEYSQQTLYPMWRPTGLAVVVVGNPSRPVDGVNTIGMLLTSTKANTDAGYPGISAEDEGRDPD